VSISSTLGRAFRTTIGCVFVAASSHCSGLGGECLRYTDCSSGLTCSDGRCVQLDASDEEADAANDAEDGAADRAAVSSESAVADASSEAIAPEASGNPCPQDSGCVAESGSDAASDALTVTDATRDSAPD
jgi:hypothetical protein